MNYETNYLITKNILVGKIAEEFGRSVHLIENLSDTHYTKIGAHFRHNLDFLSAFLNGLETGKIDYQNRKRDIRIEQNRQFAVEQIGFSMKRLHSLMSEDLKKEIFVRSEVGADIWHTSSVSRELEFLHSHTVHHHALIAEKLSNLGVKASSDFGVAPSTLKFWAEQRKKAA